ncbi:DUF2268 domain-containing protein [Roseomonas sp. OT10]|uniref:DUF2268 domain-containing putative Zn-dependent protease n=1 Tax=Roseomonas cutis TaxID=2897332 RepID=UPI001E4BB136|nr:DUF2268 domain-containing putative Zn-dependent protease [Roseomonas sp. OT10]UFN46911.1 DUF2268 domain-containing protein [Roseomonas sp. OT10]
MAWQLHWLEAEGSLAPWRDRIGAEIDAARTAVARLLPPPRLDILVQRLPGAGIPELGMVGHAYRKALFALTLDPDNPNFAASLSGDALRRMVVHEAHHCLRMGAVGYSRNLGDALVSEGLAGQFVRRLLGTPPEPWEAAATEAELHAHRPDAATLAAPRYDHDAWFFGARGLYPRWIGYTLGYRIVADWLAVEPEPDGALWAGVATEAVLAAARGGVLAREG